MGDKIDRNSVRGTLNGKRFTMENADGGGFDLVLEGNTLTGTGKVRTAGAQSSTVYVKKQ